MATGGTVGSVFQQIAQDAIDKKRSQLGNLVGRPSAGLEVVEGGFESFVQHFDNGLDIYFSAGDSEAHEVHGDIKRKYDIVSPPSNKSLFGLPMTDESPAASNGRFNDFGTDRSIYWHSAIGPRLLRDPLRDSWRQQGGEGGGLGYPVKDEKRWPTLNPATDPPFFYCIFQHGANASSQDGTLNAQVAKIDPGPLAQVVRKQFDVKLHNADDSIGLDPGIKIVSVSEWSSDLMESSNRVITYQLSGFHSNPLIQDTTFVFDIGLRFRLQMEDVFGNPSVGSLIVEMLPGSLRVQAFGIGAGTLQSLLQQGISRALQAPLVLNSQVEVSDANGPILLDLIVSSDGGLRFIVNPLPTIAGNFRQLVVQRFIDEQALPSLLK